MRKIVSSAIFARLSIENFNAVSVKSPCKIMSCLAIWLDCYFFRWVWVDTLLIAVYGVGKASRCEQVFFWGVLHFWFNVLSKNTIKNTVKRPAKRHVSVMTLDMALKGRQLPDSDLEVIGRFHMIGRRFIFWVVRRRRDSYVPPVSFVITDTLVEIVLKAASLPRFGPTRRWESE